MNRQGGSGRGAAAAREGTTSLAAFDPAFRGEWRWAQPRRLRRRWELRCDATPVATMTLPGVWRGPGGAVFADGAWRFRMRLFGGFTVVRDGAESPWARFRPGWFSGGMLERTTGPALRWAREDFWMRRWAFTTSEHLPLVRFAIAGTFLRMEARIEIEDAARRLDDLEGLLATGWLLVHLAHRGHSGYH